MRYTKSTATGAFIDKKTLVTGQRAKLVSECVPVERDYEGKPQTQHIAKVQVEGATEPKNAALNLPTRNGLIDAFGEDSKSWMGQTLTIETEKTTIGGKRVIILYLVPAGFAVMEDEGGYVIVARKVAVTAPKVADRPAGLDPDAIDQAFEDFGAEPHEEPPVEIPGEPSVQ